MWRTTFPLALVTLLNSNCGDSGSSGSSGTGAGSSTNSSSGSGGETGNSSSSGVLPTGPGDGDWETAFTADPVGMNCSSTLAELEAAGAAMIKRGAVTLVVGYEQLGQNQDPVLLRFDDGERTYCQYHEQEPPDGRAYGITWDGGPVAYVVYSIVGGGSAFDSLAAQGWIASYGDGGGSSKVMVLGSVDTASGSVQQATFEPAKRDNGSKTNTLGPAGPIVVLEDGSLEVVGNSAFAPLNPDKSGMCLPDVEYPSALDGARGPNFLGRFSPDLSMMVCASTAGCSNVTVPCE
jgi:hypothetical protein